MKEGELFFVDDKEIDLVSYALTEDHTPRLGVTSFKGIVASGNILIYVYSLENDKILFVIVLKAFATEFWQA